ncbi:polyisoprenoid-binding protein [Acidovorax citrulli]|nr:polyisoprenoid-binding protein [Paracidovorax citrulli]
MKFSPSLFAGLALASSALLAGAPAFAQQKLVPEQSEITFVSKQMGVPVEGPLQEVRCAGGLRPPPSSPRARSRSRWTPAAPPLGVKESDAELPKATWFNVPRFPQATFQSTAIKSTGPGKFEVAGKLSIKGATQDVVAPVTLTQNGATTIATGSFPIKRLAFKIGENEWADTSMVADEVQVKFKLALTGVGKL